MQRIGFIGIGVMGASMVRNLLKKGFQVSVYNRSSEKAAVLTKDGAVFCRTLKECVQNKELIVTMIGFPKDVEEVYFGKDSIFEYAQKGACIVDMTTTSPKLSQKIYNLAKEKGLHALDAPVSGGDIGAANATLTIMVGGDKVDFDTCLPAFEAMGTNLVYEGPAGSGQHVKMANQIAVAGTTLGVCEAVAYTKAMGIDPTIMLKTICSGAAASWQIDNNGPKMARDDASPGFFIKHFVKDMKIALEEAKSAGISLGILQEVCDIYEKMEQDGMGELGTQAVIKTYLK